MDRKKYKISFLPLFEDDLNNITNYIINNLQNPDAALRLIDDI
jgi:toxin ParE1/3/4